jgi:hypothetical protein
VDRIVTGTDFPQGMSVSSRSFRRGYPRPHARGTLDDPVQAARLLKIR